MFFYSGSFQNRQTTNLYNHHAIGIKINNLARVIYIGQI